MNENIFNKIIECGYGYTRFAPMFNQLVLNVCLLTCGIII